MNGGWDPILSCYNSWSTIIFLDNNKIHNRKFNISQFNNGNRAKFIHSQICTFHTLIWWIENTFDTWIYKKIQNLCGIYSLIISYFIC